MHSEDVSDGHFFIHVRKVRLSFSKMYRFIRVFLCKGKETEKEEENTFFNAIANSYGLVCA